MVQTWLSFQPPDHLLDRRGVWSTFLLGGRTGFFDFDLSQLYASMAALRPTVLTTTARVWTALQAEYRELVAELLSSGAAVDEASAHARASAQLRAKLGGRVTTMRNSAAPIHASVLKWMRECFGARVVDAYGSSEADGAISAGKATEGVELRLSDVPELGYRTSDKPHARGQIEIRSAKLFSGYYGDPELTAAAFTADGFFRTGDIGEALPDGRVQIIDRLKNVFKLSQGEFVAPEPLETTYATCPSVAQICIHCSPLHDFVVAVVVPRTPVPAGETGALASRLRDELAAAGRAAGFKSWEIPRGVVVAREPFSHAAGTLTGPSKIARHGVAKRFAAELASLLEALASPATPAASQSELVALLQAASADARGLDLALALAVRLLPPPPPGEAPLTPEHLASCGLPLRALGVDSLGAARLSAVLHAGLGLELTANALLDDALTLQALGEAIDEVRGPSSAGAGASSSSSSLARRLGAAVVATLQRDALWPADEAAAVLAPAPAELCATRSAAWAAPRGVLLTGATGFIGRFLVEALVGEAPLRAAGTTLYCLVRARTEAEASERLWQALADTPLARRDADSGRPVAASAELGVRIVPLVGAIDAPCGTLGLGAEGYARLQEETDVVVHSAAFVNHVLPYSAHRPANVDATRALVRFCLCLPPARLDRSPSSSASSLAVPRAGQPIKWLHVLSSVGAVTGDMFTRTAEAGAPLRVLESTRPGTMGLARLDGYSQSKWVVECLLHALGSAGWPVTVHRCAFVSSHSTRGVGNAEDMMCRLACSMAQLRLTPAVTPRHRVDMTPVDFVACAVARAVARPREVLAAAGAGDSSAAFSAAGGPFPQVYNVVSAGHSMPLSELVQALERAGYGSLPAAASMAEWVAAVRAEPDTPFAPLVHRLRGNDDDMERAHALDATRFRAAMAATGGATLAQLAARDVSAGAMDAMVSWLQRTGALQPPHRTSRL